MSFDVHSVNSQVYAGALSSFKDFLFQLLAYFAHNLLDAGGMDTSVHYQLVERKACHLPADRVECGKEDCVRSVIDNYFNAGGGLQGPDVAALTADDAALDLVILNRECGYGVLNGGFSCGALYGVDYYSLGFLGSVQACLVYGLVDIGLGLCAGFRLHILHKHCLGLVRSHSGYGLQLLVHLG